MTDKGTSDGVGLGIITSTSSSLLDHDDVDESNQYKSVFQSVGSSNEPKLLPPNPAYNLRPVDQDLMVPVG
jgi:hypothetical protein